MSRSITRQVESSSAVPVNGRESEPVRGHRVFAGDGAERTDLFIRAVVALNADTAHRLWEADAIAFHLAVDAFTAVDSLELDTALDQKIIGLVIVASLEQAIIGLEITQIQLVGQQDQFVVGQVRKRLKAAQGFLLYSFGRRCGPGAAVLLTAPLRG